VKSLPREQLRQRLWPERTYVDFDGSLNVTQKKLRAALDDDSDNPRFMETVPRRTCRFIAPATVESVAVELSASANGRVARNPAAFRKGPKESTAAPIFMPYPLSCSSS
jgi:DNA-binding winged helix-turn-helix (wHTH) protein